MVLELLILPRRLAALGAEASTEPGALAAAGASLCPVSAGLAADLSFVEEKSFIPENSEGGELQLPLCTRTGRESHFLKVFRINSNAVLIPGLVLIACPSKMYTQL